MGLFSPQKGRYNYLVKQSNDDNWQGGENYIVQRLTPVIIESLTREARLESIPKLSQCECKILVKEVGNNLHEKIFLSSKYKEQSSLFAMQESKGYILVNLA